MYVLEVIVHNLHHDDCPAQFYGAGTQPLRGMPLDYSKPLRTFNLSFVIGYLYLSLMSALTTKLQRKSNDIFKAFTMVSSVLKSFQDMRADMDAMYDDA